MTSRQFYIMFSLIVISLKVQKMPCFMADALGKDGYILVIFYFLLDLILITLALFISKRTRENSFEFNNIFMIGLKKILLLFVAIYFLLLGVLYYETIQDLFSHILFDNLPWSLFSLLLIALVFYLANTGIKNIALNFELYSVIVFFSLLIIMIFGITRTDFTSVLPFCTIDLAKVGGTFMDFNFWFGDFFFVLLLSREARDVKFKWTILVYVLSMFAVIVFNIEFYSIYLSYASMQPSLISVISEQSMLGIGVGRLDWFLILLTEIGTILSASVCMFYAKKSLGKVFPKVNETWFLAALMLGLYLLDIFLLVDMHTKELIYVRYLSYFGIAIKAVVMIVGMIFALKKKQKQGSKNQKEDFVNNGLNEKIVKPAKSNLKSIEKLDKKLLTNKQVKP